MAKLDLLLVIIIAALIAVNVIMAFNAMYP